MQTIHCFIDAPPANQDVTIAAITLNQSLAIFQLSAEGQLVEPEPANGNGEQVSCSWVVPRTVDPCRCLLNILPAQQAAQSSDAKISITQAGHVVDVVDNNDNSLTQPVQVKGTASGGDGVTLIYLNY